MLRHCLAVLALTGAAHAGTPLEPPARFDHPFAGQLIIHKIARSNVWAECSHDGAHAMRKDAAGCAFLDGDTCTIYLATKTRRAPVAAILRHEIAHCNGWAADHPE